LLFLTRQESRYVTTTDKTDNGNRNSPKHLVKLHVFSTVKQSTFIVSIFCGFERSWPTVPTLNINGQCSSSEIANYGNVQALKLIRARVIDPVNYCMSAAAIDQLPIIKIHIS
jgi:hypothetical protein